MKGLTDGTYTLVEASAPEGYMVAEKIEFTIEDGMLVEDENVKDGTVIMKDEQKKTDVQISKVEAGQGNELAGAALILTKEGQDGTVAKWKSDGSIHVVAERTGRLSEGGVDHICHQGRQAGRGRQRCYR